MLIRSIKYDHRVRRVSMSAQLFVATDEFGEPVSGENAFSWQRMPRPPTMASYCKGGWRTRLVGKSGIAAKPGSRLVRAWHCCARRVCCIPDSGLSCCSAEVFSPVQTSSRSAVGPPAVHGVRLFLFIGGAIGLFDDHETVLFVRPASGRVAWNVQSVKLTDWFCA